MPVVPTLDPSNDVLPSQAPDPQLTNVTTASLLNQGNQQIGQAGAALTDAGNAASSIAINAQQLANQVVVNDAVNKLKTTQQNLMYAPQTGVTAQTGQAAIQRESGMSLADEYTGKLSDAASQIGSTLANPVQQRMFQEQAADITTQFHGATTQWEGQQFKAYALSTQNGAIKLASDAVGQNYNNPDLIDQNLQSIKAAVYTAGQVSGMAATDIEANTKIATSGALQGAVDTALQKGQIAYANGLMQKYGSDMTANDILKVNGKLTAYMGVQAASQSVNTVFANLGPQLSNSNFDRMVNITAKAESNGHETNPDGSTVTSPAGAQGVMQVLPSTNMDPGFGVKPAADDSPAERARVGRDYLQAMLGRYGGDPAKAWAAYNAGPATLDAAISSAKGAGAPGTWLANMPSETQRYVATNMQTYSSGQGNYQRPTLLDVLTPLRADPILQSHPDWMSSAVTLATQRYAETTAALDQKDLANSANVMRTLDKNGGDWGAVPPDMLAEVNPKDIPTLQTYAKNITLGVNATNPAVYQKLATDPTALAGMSDDQFYALKGDLSMRDFAHFSNMRNELVNGTGSKAPGSLNMGAMNLSVDTTLQSMGIDPHPAKGNQGAMEQVGAIRQFLDQGVLDAQKQAGKKFSEAEIQSFVKQQFIQSVPLKGMTILGFHITSDSSKQMLSMTASDIPGDIKDSLKSDFKAHGNSNPSDGDLLGAYWTMQSAAKKMTGQR